MKTLRRVLTTTVIALAATAAASADTIIFHTGVLTAATISSAGPTTFNFGNGGAQPNVPLNINEFNCATINGRSDPSGGTDENCQLTSIHFAVNAAINTSFSVTNTSGSTASYQITSSAILAIVNAGGGGAAFTFVEALPSQTLNTGNIPNGATGTYSVPANATASADYVCAPGGGGGGAVSCVLGAHTGGTPSSPINADPFIGAGTLTLFAIGDFTGSIGGTGFTGSVGGNASESISATYDYSFDQVIPAGNAPEPVTTALVGGGLVALGLFRKRLKG